jgi:tRNA-binding protein
MSQLLPSNPLSWDEFLRVDIRVGTILNAEAYPEARNPSYKLVVDFGPLGKKRSSAQITKLYGPEMLIGKQVVGVVNFPPKQIGKFLSECLILGVMGEGNVVTLLQPTHDVKNGDRIG